MRKLRWSTGLTLVFVLALVGTAAAKPPTVPPVEPVVTIEALELTCLDAGHLSAAATVSAGDQTSLSEIHLVILELKSVASGAGGYFPYDAVLQVAQWGDGIRAGEERGKPGQGLPNPTTFTLSTVDGPDHYWNTMLGDETPAADSWFEVSAHGHGNSTSRSGDWAANDRTDFINCGTNQVMTNANNPWNDWNYPEEG